jgi:integrase
MSTSRRSNGEGSIFPRKNGFAAYTWVITPDGRKVRKYVYGKTRDEVHAKWIELTQRAAKSPVPNRVPTLSQYLARWLTETVAPNLAPLTYATYEGHVHNYIEPGIGDIRLDRLNVARVQSWLNGLPTKCQCCAHGRDQKRAENGHARCCAIGKCCDATPSARTIQDVRNVLRTALSHAMREELVSRNVASLVRLPTRRPRKVVPWTSEEARRFLESAKTDGDPLYAAYTLVLVLGMRKGEVLGLTWPNIDLANQVVVVEKQLQRVRRELLHRQTKTAASDNDLPMPDIVVAAIAARRSEQAADRNAAEGSWLGAPEGPHFVFTGAYGYPIDPRGMNRRFTARCEAAGVRRMTVHDARRTCATLLVDLGIHPRVIMRILRQADMAVTMEIYAKASSDSTREALRRLGESLH